MCCELDVDLDLIPTPQLKIKANSSTEKLRATLAMDSGQPHDLETRS